MTQATKDISLMEVKQVLKYYSINVLGSKKYSIANKSAALANAPSRDSGCLEYLL
jgi:hypothetical protein